jgi:predicted nucleic acid-binding protein
MARDPDDDFLLEVPVEAQVDFIITYNQNDRRSAEQFGI